MPSILPIITYFFFITVPEVGTIISPTIEMRKLWNMLSKVVPLFTLPRSGRARHSNCKKGPLRSLE